MKNRAANDLLHNRPQPGVHQTSTTLSREFTGFFDRPRCHKCQVQFLLLLLTSDNGCLSCLYERYATKFWLRQFKGAIMTTAAMPRRRQEIENEEYRQRMLVNALAASFITLMIVSDYWIVNTLVQVS
jgi:transposase-like protein